jgi:pimeloyl-ACP methyl ester carboxylesterase
VPGATIGYDVAGPPDAPAVLFVHAGVATRAMWDPQFDSLAADHRVIRYDTRGYGDSPGEAVAYSEVDDLLRMLDAAGL